MNVKRATKTIRRCTVVLNAEDVIALLRHYDIGDAPLEDASDVRVACGNCDVDIDDETPIRITWTEETTS